MATATAWLTSLSSTRRTRGGPCSGISRSPRPCNRTGRRRGVRHVPSAPGKEPCRHGRRAGRRSHRHATRPLRPRTSAPAESPLGAGRRSHLFQRRLELGQSNFIGTAERRSLRLPPPDAAPTPAVRVSRRWGEPPALRRQQPIRSATGCGREARRLGQPRHETIEPHCRMTARAPGPPSGTPGEET
jgi:hypothetical protein